MAFTTSAVLLAVLVGTFGDTSTIEIARFGNGEIGKEFCDGTANSISQAPSEEDSFFYCASPKEAREILKAQKSG